MADQLQAITVQAPGFLGLNTQEAALVTKEGWCLNAQNCVFDANGRLAARNGFAHQGDPTADAVDIISMGEWVIDSTVQDVFFADTGGKIYKGITAKTDETGAVAANDGHWQWINYKDNIIGVRQDEVPIFWASGSTDMAVITGAASYGAVGSGDLNGNCALSAFGRCWIMDSDKQTIHISQTLDLNFGAADSYELDVSSVWPSGDDHVTALAAFQGRLVVFGERNILIYANPDDLNGTSFDAVAGASTFQLEDTIAGVGCIARDSVQQIGEDVWFLSETGIRSLARSIQTESLPLTDVSFHNRSTLMDQVDNLTDYKTIKSVYNAIDGFYILNIPNSSGANLSTNTWYFDTKKPLETSARRAAKWTNIPITSMIYSNDLLYFGLTLGEIGKYDGYQDNGSSYRMSYLSSWADFESTNLKIPKKMRMTVTGGYSYNINFRWAFDFSDQYTSATRGVELNSQDDPDEYNVAEWGAMGYDSFPQWAASTAYADAGANIVVATTEPTGADEGKWFACTTDGTSDTSEPTWDYTVGNTTADGTAVWTCRAAFTDYAEWSGAGSGNLINTLSVPMKKSGQHIQYGFTVDIDGSAFAVQRIDVYAKVGRLNR